MMLRHVRTIEPRILRAPWGDKSNRHRRGPFTMLGNLRNDGGDGDDGDDGDDVAKPQGCGEEETCRSCGSDVWRTHTFLPGKHM